MENHQTTLRVWLIHKEIRHLPHKARKFCAYTFDMKCPLPAELEIPILGGKGGTRFYKRMFAVITGGENGKIKEVYYIEQQDDSRRLA